MELVFEDDDAPYVINKYEYTSILRERILQLRNGDPPRIDASLLEGVYDEQTIAELEIKHFVCPVGVKKRVRGGKYVVILIRGGEIIVTN